jgi:transcriptional regulator with XRE-family HTH domain
MAQSPAIKILLLSHGVKQRDIAEATGADKAAVSKVVSGRLTSGPQAVKIAKTIAKAVRQPVAALFPWAA